MMQFIFKKWQEKLSQFESSVDQEIKEIRKCKADIQKMRQEADFELHKGRYIHDDERIILSAPEIIIGHVDRNGSLIDHAGSTVIVRGSQIGLQGVGEGGQVEMRARGIRQIAEDPGIDGEEHVVGSRSEVVSQARHIVIHSQDAEDMFSMEPTVPSGSGVRIHADKAIEIDASVPGPTFKKAIQDVIGKLEETQQNLRAQSTSHKSTFDQMTSSMEELLKKKEYILSKPAILRAAYGDIEKVNDFIEQLSLSLSQEVCQYAQILSQLAETSRQLKCLKTQKDKIKEGDAIANETTGASVSVKGENIRLVSKDDEDKMHVNPGAGVEVLGRTISMKSWNDDLSSMDGGTISLSAQNVEVDTTNTFVKERNDEGNVTSAKVSTEGSFTVSSQNVKITAVDKEYKDGVFKQTQLTPNSSISLQAQNVDINTAQVQNEDVNDYGEITSAEYPADGKVVINSKSITLQSVDSEYNSQEEDGRAETALAPESSIKIRSERVGISTLATEGKATGSIRLNSKNMEIQSVDYDQNDDGKMADDGVISVISDRVYLGASRNKKMVSHKVQAWADKITLLGTKAMQAIQGDKGSENRSVLLLKNENAQLKGKKTELHGPTKIVGDLDAPKIKAGDLTVDGEIKSTNIGDGITVGPPPKSTLKIDDDGLTEEEQYEQYSD